MECSDSPFGIFKLFLLMENIFVDKDKYKIASSMKISWQNRKVAYITSF